MPQTFYDRPLPSKSLGTISRCRLKGKEYGPNSSEIIDGHHYCNKRLGVEAFNGTFLNSF